MLHAPQRSLQGVSDLGSETNRLHDTNVLTSKDLEYCLLKTPILHFPDGFSQ